ncbi:GIY-YIG nuclease family protein [Algibacter pectinivorans]|uniref:Putative endonuclease n=1 Tax=Algibacter pectinivorans TaxID=870482 RepID=A0A1I1Q656_9FLAO|nr:GIY-YIG nuclease family protein [Algibacter pectinivorans]SFD15338.1 putative endonuclease [Algibacter pectinivorans]
MIYYVYVIRSEKDNQQYIGLTEDLEKEVTLHNMGEYAETRTSRPWVLVQTKVFTSLVDAKGYSEFLKKNESI